MEQWQNVHRTLETDQAAGKGFFELLVRTMREQETTRPHHQPPKPPLEP